MKFNKKTRKKVSSIRKQMTAAFMLWTLLTLVFVPSLSAETRKAPTGMVYCPLSRKFQPINPPEINKESEVFGDLCANRQTKDFLFQEFTLKNSFGRISFNQEKLDDLAFDYLAHGESGLTEQPHLPDFPSQNLIRQISLSFVTNNVDDHQFVWKQPARYYSLTFLARPPTTSNVAFFLSDSVYQSDQISRRIAPRAPPVRS